MPEPNTQYMTCMEIWGGNTPTTNAVAMPGLDAWVYSLPYASAPSGGDVYYVSSCATGRITRLLVADVSGHGDAVTDTATTLRSLMRRYVNHLNPQSFLQSMNAQFTKLSASNSFATAVVSTFFGPTSELTLCNAGHPSPLLFRHKSKSWSLLQHSENNSQDNANTDIANIPLGIDDASNYTQLTLQLNPNDLVLCYTDSLIESHDPTGTLLGEQGLLQLLQQLPTPSLQSDPSSLIPTLLQKLQSLHPKNLTEDDITLLLFRPNPTTPPPNFLRRALAPFHVLALSLASLFPNRPPAPLPDLSPKNLLGLPKKRRQPPSSKNF